MMSKLEISHPALPSMSPDLNPIKHMWDVIQRALYTHEPATTTVLQLRAALL